MLDWPGPLSREFPSSSLQIEKKQHSAAEAFHLPVKNKNTKDMSKNIFSFKNILMTILMAYMSNFFAFYFQKSSTNVISSRSPQRHHWALFTRCFEDNPPKEVFQNAEGHDLWKIIVSPKMGKIP
jgi:hypothetical protein